jgi:Flp pilus assembly pilin Flp
MEALQALKRRIARAGHRGVTTVEYAVMLVLVAVAVLTFGAYLGDSVKDTFSRVVVWLGSSNSGGSGDSASAPLGNQGRGGGNGNGNGNGRGNGNGNGDVNGNGGGVGN